MLYERDFFPIAGLSLLCSCARFNITMVSLDGGYLTNIEYLPVAFIIGAIMLLRFEILW